jgi:CRP-like cAMP-binding protein
MRVPCFECALRRTGAFKPINDLELAFINEMKRDHLVCPPGGEIIAAGQDQAELYTLYAGWAIRCKTLPDGRRQILNILLPGDLIGLQGAMFEAAAYSVEAITEVQLCLLPRRKMWSLFENMPELAFDVTWLGLARGKHRRREPHQHRPAHRRGAHRGADHPALQTPQRARHGVNGAMPFPLTQQAHRRHARSVAGHTNKSLAKLRKLGMFSQTNSTLLLSNPKALESLAQYFDEEVAKRPLI